MKRSEVVTFLASSFISRGMVSFSMSPEAADEILAELEKLGMSPPSYMGLMANGKKYNKETDFGRDTMMIYSRWEPEEKEKS